MTALTEYQRLEAAGLWRADPKDQRRDVIVSIGEATLVLSDLHDRPLAHWSLAALMRANPGETPAIYYPQGDPGETLELPEAEEEMIAALEKLRNVIERRRPRPGRLRLWLGGAILASVIAGAIIWLPGALQSHAVSVVPAVKRAALGQSLLEEMRRVTGPACANPGGQKALDQLAQRLTSPRDTGQTTAPNLLVVRDGVPDAVALPGNTILINRALVEDFEEPDVVAGFTLAAMTRARVQDPLAEILDRAGMGATIKLLTSGTLPDPVLRAHAHYLLTGDLPRPDAETLLAAFDHAQLRSTPYARAIDVTGETVLPLIEADPHARSAPPPLMSDGNWLRLQAICGA
jgi:hypothetical protein